MKVAISGANGFIGRHLAAHFEKLDYAVTRIARDQFERPSFDAASLAGHDVVIHLAGAPIAGRRWTVSYKKTIFDSRVVTTKLLCESLAKASLKPFKIFIASAAGYYGNVNPAVAVNESSSPGEGFLSEVCQAWETAALPAKQAGIDVVFMRFGLVIGSNGGVLAKMIPVFKMGAGGRLGSGGQIMSWIALEEIPLIIEYLIKMPQISGPVNFVSVNPVSNLEFTRCLGKVLKRPVIFPVPSAVLKLLFGEMAGELFLSGARVVPQKLLQGGYQFKHPDLEAALLSLIKKQH